MAGMVAVSVLFGVVGFYLTLIAKFYRQKFMKGPPHRYLQLSLAAIVAGLILETGVAGSLPPQVPAFLICSGGLAFSSLCYSLYRTMMSKG
jgi:hypothetical protein